MESVGRKTFSMTLEFLSMNKDAALVTAILTFLTALIWPAVFIWVVIRFRTQFENLLDRLTSADVVGNKFVFQQSSSEASSTPDAKVEISQIGADGFFTAEGIRAIVTQSGTLPKGDVAEDQLLIFDNGRQHTWLVSTRSKMVIVLDDENTRARNRVVQRVLDKDDVFPLDFAMTENGATTVGFGHEPLPSWYYSSSLFPSSDYLRDGISKLVRRSAESSVAEDRQDRC
jgi:hypothetical protein